MNAECSPIDAQIERRRTKTQPSDEGDRQPRRHPDDDRGPATLPERVARGVDDVGQGEEQRRPDDRPLRPIERSQAVSEKPRNTDLLGDRCDHGSDEELQQQPPIVPVGGSGLAGVTEDQDGEDARRGGPSRRSRAARERGTEREVVDGPPVEPPDPHLGPGAARSVPTTVRRTVPMKIAAVNRPLTSLPTGADTSPRRADRGQRGRTRRRNATKNVIATTVPNTRERRRPGVRRAVGPALEGLVAAGGDQAERQQPRPDEQGEHPRAAERPADRDREP